MSWNSLVFVLLPGIWFRQKQVEKKANYVHTCKYLGELVAGVLKSHGLIQGVSIPPSFFWIVINLLNKINCSVCYYCYLLILEFYHVFQN